MPDAKYNRQSGLTLEYVKNAKFAVSHAERTELSEPRYLLPKEHRLGNMVFIGKGQEPQIAALMEQRLEQRSRQAKTAKSMPFWEASINLPAMPLAPTPDQVIAYKKDVARGLKKWQVQFEAETGTKVLHLSVHLDEGEVSKDGSVHYNTHAHAILDRMASGKKMWSPSRGQLAKVQTFTAECLGMERGSTIAERNGAPARKHIGHKEWRAAQTELKRLRAEKDALEEEKAAQDSQIKALTAANAVGSAKLKATQKIASESFYGALRGFLKGTGKAVQADYQNLKTTFAQNPKLIEQLAQHLQDESADPAVVLGQIRMGIKPIATPSILSKLGGLSQGGHLKKP